MDMGKNSWEDGASEHIPTHLKQLQTKADAYQKAGDIKSANALRDKIKIIKTKHGMAPASTQKAEGKKPFDRLNTQYTKSKFNIGDKVRSIHNPNMIGEVSHTGPYDDYLGTHRYKVLEPNGRRQYWNGTGMVKISDEEHAKGTSYYKPTQKTEVEDLSKSGLSPENRMKYAKEKADNATEIAYESGDLQHHANAAFWHRKAAGVAQAIHKSTWAAHHNDMAILHDSKAGKLKGLHGTSGVKDWFGTGNPTESVEKSESETRLAILAKGLKAAITLRGLVKAEKRIDHDKEAGLTTLDKTPSGHVKVANGHAKAGDYLDHFGTRHKVLGVSKDKRTVTTVPVASPKGEEPTVKEHLKESHPYYHYSQHKLITSDEAKNGVSKEKGYLVKAEKEIKSSGGGNK